MIVQIFLAIARVQRQISDGGQTLLPEQQPNLQAPLSQEPSPVVSPSATPRPQFPPAALKSPPFTHPSAVGIVRHPTPSHSPHDAPASPSPSLEHVKMKESVDPYVQAPPVQKPAAVAQTFQPRLPVDSSFSQQTRFSFMAARPPVQGIRQDGPEINRQLRDLLQKHQFQKLDNQLLPGKGHQRIWPPVTEAAVQEQEQPAAPTVQNSDATFRHPLPPGIVRPRLPVPAANTIRPPIQRLQAQARLQNLDPRMRALFQQVRYIIQQNLSMDTKI